jgi:endo-1,3-1,4-beta-glycanase ExoK
MIKILKQKNLLLFVLTSLLIFLPAFQGFAQFTEDMNGGSGLFVPSDGWTNGSPFNCTWRASSVTFSGGIMSLTMDRESGTPPYKSGEYRSNNFYKYGLYEVRMKAAKASGIVTSFFTYTGSSDSNPWDEIDIEILGKDPTKMQTNYFTNGTGGHDSTHRRHFIHTHSNGFRTESTGT